MSPASDASIIYTFVYACSTPKTSDEDTSATCGGKRHDSNPANNHDLKSNSSPKATQTQNTPTSHTVRLPKKARKFASVAAWMPVGARSIAQKTAEKGTAASTACPKRLAEKVQPLPKTGRPVREHRPTANTAAPASVSAAAQNVSSASRGGSCDAFGQIGAGAAVDAERWVGVSNGSNESAEALICRWWVLEGAESRNVGEAMARRNGKGRARRRTLENCGDVARGLFNRAEVPKDATAAKAARGIDMTRIRDEVERGHQDRQSVEEGGKCSGGVLAETLSRLVDQWASQPRTLGSRKHRFLAICSNFSCGIKPNYTTSFNFITIRMFIAASSLARYFIEYGMATRCTWLSLPTHSLQ